MLKYKESEVLRERQLDSVSLNADQSRELDELIACLRRDIASSPRAPKRVRRILSMEGQEHKGELTK